MTATSLLYPSLVLHICGLALWSGTTVTEYVLFKQFWKIYVGNKEKGVITYQLIRRLPSLGRAGMGLLLLSGITMFLATDGVFGAQIWFQVKMILVLIAIINALVPGRRLGRALRNLLNDEASGNNDLLQFEVVRRRIRFFHIVQMSIFLVIFICSIFKFNA
jgi:uncharacterized membrane protein SirB2